ILADKAFWEVHEDIRNRFSLTDADGQRLFRSGLDALPIDRTVEQLHQSSAGILSGEKDAFGVYDVETDPLDVDRRFRLVLKNDMKGKTFHRYNVSRHRFDIDCVWTNCDVDILRKSRSDKEKRQKQGPHCALKAKAKMSKKSTGSGYANDQPAV